MYAREMTLTHATHVDGQDCADAVRERGQQRLRVGVIAEERGERGLRTAGSEHPSRTFPSS